MKKICLVVVLMAALTLALAQPPAAPTLSVVTALTNNVTVTNITRIANNVCVVKPGGILPVVEVYGVTNVFKNPNTVTLAWDPSPDPTVTGTFFYYGPVSTNTTNVFGVRSNVTVVVLSNVLDTNLTYWFFVTATNQYGVESEPSNVVVTDAR